MVGGGYVGMWRSYGGGEGVKLHHQTDIGDRVKSKCHENTLMILFLLYV